MSQNPIKLYVNRSLMIPGMSHIPLLYPFLGPVVKETVPYVAQAAKQTTLGSRNFVLVDSMDEADFVVIPHPYQYLERFRKGRLREMVREAENGGKPLLIDGSGDIERRIDIPNSVILRISQYRFSVAPNEVTIPVFAEDLLASYCNGTFSPRQKSAVPVVGFAGWGRIRGFTRLRSLTKELPIRLLGLFIPKYRVYEKGVFWRERAIYALRNSSRVRTNFIVRDSYSGHVKTLSGDPERNRREFVKNILDSDYTLIVKGDANAATRFYETLSLGRIPVFIDTACVLPLEDCIDYKEFCVFIDYTDIERAPDILADFHERISPEDFIAMQREARYIFENFLQRERFPVHLAEILRRKINA